MAQINRKTARPANGGSRRENGKKREPETSEKRRGEAAGGGGRKRQIYSVVLFAAGLLLMAFSAIGDANAETKSAWDWIHIFLRGIFGFSVFFIGPAMIYAAVMIAKDKRKSAVVVKLIQLAAIILLISGAVQILFAGNVGGINDMFESGTRLGGGGVIGMVLAYPLMFFGRVGASIIVLLIAFVFIMLMANITLDAFLKFTAKPFKKAGDYAKSQRERHRLDAESAETADRRRAEEEALARMSAAERDIEKEIEKDTYFAGIMSVTDSAANRGEYDAPFDISDTEKTPRTAQKPIYVLDSPLPETAPEMPFPEIPPPFPLAEKLTEFNEENDSVEDAFNRAAGDAGETAVKYGGDESKLSGNPFYADGLDGELPKRGKIEAELEISDISAIGEYRLPSVKLLDEFKKRRSENDIAAELEMNSNKLVETLKSFGVMTKIVGVVRGPSVTRYEIQPAPGVKISKITSLTDDIALNLAAAGVRMEAPIPGKSAVGVEVPNSAVDTVSIRELIDSADFRDTDSNLGAVIGKSISGDIIISDIAKMPHLLIAGTTGSGKSVCVNSIIMSILFRSTPDDVRLIMIDPKSVEFMIYSGIPHLLTPVVSDPKKAAGALKWAVNEMTQRYALFAENNVRDISGYNEAAKINEELMPMTKIVIFIDELADLMMTAAREVEESICRLAQMARAAGIHLVIATQRPTVNVVTGLIKANIPSRIALKVASQVDSRTIIDTAGADKLLGKGDMLYAPVGMPKPVRVQGCWVSDKEVERVVGFIKDKFDSTYDEDVIKEIDRQAEAVSAGDKGRDEDDIDMDDDKLEDAVEAVIDAGKASTSYLQLKLKLGYGRAARLIDIMEKMGVVGKFEGSKPREVLMTRQDWLERKMNIGK
ncbi:MAG: DNA translocase FtsK [Oscillospiraceae bacterium]|jgi:S-DNA-T family DNA segregation ATPase FtsK/SpoIIIE|nr:DNA translocase FtsK [Oscillospiraceae bacterium]